MIIGICGGTGSGKTTIARRIVEEVGAENVILLEQDSYYRNLIDMPLDERHLANFDHPDSIDSDMLVGHLKRLKDGLDVEMPIYDFKTHTRSDRVATLHPKPVVMVEGILIFAEPRIRELLDIRVFVDTPDDIRFIRRLQRDIRDRGRTTQSVIDQYFATVRPMHMEFVEASKRFADIIIPEAAQADTSTDLLCGLVREKLRKEQTKREEVKVGVSD
jgi:uridine kinase